MNPPPPQSLQPFFTSHGNEIEKKIANQVQAISVVPLDQSSISVDAVCHLSHWVGVDKDKTIVSRFPILCQHTVIGGDGWTWT